MRRFVGIAAVAAALSMLACETSNAQRREGRTPSRYNDTSTRPVENRPPPGEYRPNDLSPMRGDESFPAEYPGSSRSGLGDAVGGSADTPVGSGSTIDRRATTPSAGAPSSGYQSPSGETGSAPTNSDRLTPGTTGTGSSRSVESENRYQDPAGDTSKNTESSTTSSTGTGTSTGMSSGEPSDSAGQVGSGSKSSANKKAQGRTGSQSSTVRPRSGVGAPPASDPLGNTNSDAPDVSGTPPIPSDAPTSSNPYDLGAAKNPKGAADAGTATDGGTRFEGNLPSDLQNTY